MSISLSKQTRKDRPVAQELPQALYSAAHARELDRLAAAEYGIADGRLMERAGAAAFNVLRWNWPSARRIAVLCGSGNNGGDGYVVARLAQLAGLQPVVMALGAPEQLTGAALAACQALPGTGCAVDAFAPERLQDCDVIVDALFGTGLEREVTGIWREAITATNALAKPVLALDLPSGLHADTGRVLGVAVQATVTITFIGLKAGLFTAQGPAYCGEILFAGLDVPAALYDRIQPLGRRITEKTLHPLVPRRRRDAHKGDHGHVLIIGGAPGMGGAVRMAGEAAYRAGAGLVSLATHPSHAAQLSGARPELISYGIEDRAQLRAAFARADVVAIGCGLSQADWGRKLWQQALDCKLPLVVDADGLNLLAHDPIQRPDWILTPHPGEAARLLGCTTAEIQADRFAAVGKLTQRYGGVCVLKGAGSLIAAGASDVWLCDRGNPGMASGGMGDVLTGIIAAMVAQGLKPMDAARLAVWIHASAGDAAARAGGEIGLMAADLMPHIRRQINAMHARAD